MRHPIIETFKEDIFWWRFGGKRLRLWPGLKELTFGFSRMVLFSNDRDDTRFFGSSGLL